MKLLTLKFVLFCVSLSVQSVYAQKSNPNHDEFKKKKLNFILDNTNLNEEEENQFNCIFSAYQEKYHEEIWLEKQKIRAMIRKYSDTISSQNASLLINRFYEIEQKESSIKYERDQKLLEKIRAVEVLNIIRQEYRFDKEMLKSIRNHSKKKKKSR